MLNIATFRNLHLSSDSSLDPNFSFLASLEMMLWKTKPPTNFIMNCLNQECLVLWTVVKTMLRSTDIYELLVVVAGTSLLGVSRACTVGAILLASKGPMSSFCSVCTVANPWCRLTVRSLPNADVFKAVVLLYYWILNYWSLWSLNFNSDVSSSECIPGLEACVKLTQQISCLNFC